MGSAWATLICYFSMMVISYRLGQKHFPIKYNLRKTGFFLGAALLVYYVFTLFADYSSSSRMLAATILMVIYLSFVAVLEYENLRKIVVSGRK